MGVIRTYFRLHRWQRRALTILVAVAMGLGAAVGLRPPIREYQLLRDLGSGDPKVRETATVRGVYLGRLYPHVVKRLNEALSTDDDQKFYAITRVLGALGSLRTAARDPNQLDRVTLIEFVTTGSRPSTAGKPAASGTASSAASQAASRSAAGDIAADTRLLLFHSAVFVGRDNPYTRRLLAAAASDESPAIRRASAVLAARFGDANTLRKLLADPNPNVVEWAAIDAGLAKVVPMDNPICELFTASRNPDVVSACAYGAAQYWLPTTGTYQNPELAARFREANDPRLQSRLAFVAALSQESVTFRSIGEAVRYLPEVVLYAPDSEVAAKILAGAVSDANQYSRLQVLAALESIDEMQNPALVEAVLRKLWAPSNALILTAAAEKLGQALAHDWSDQPDLPPRDQCMRTLREAALYEPPEDSNDPEFALAVPSAAAAVALWLREPSAVFVLNEPPAVGAEANAPVIGTQFDPNSAAYLIYLTSSGEHQLPPDYISWHLARSGNPKAFELGMNLLPPPSDPRVPASRRGFRNYSPNSREAAAMLLALSARTPDENRQAVARIAARLEGGPLGPPSNFYEIGTYQCALLILGEMKFRRNVEGLLATGAFPARRAITALCTAGAVNANAGRAGLDWLLWDAQAPAGEIANILIGTGLEEVLHVLVPELPTVDAAAGDDLRNWQVQIMQDYYRIHREKIRFARPQ